MADEPTTEEQEATEPLQVEWKGETFELADEVPGIVFLDYVRAASAGADAETLEGLAATYDMVEASLTPDAWQRFRKHAKETRATGAEIVEIIGLGFEARAGRPTVRPDDSSPGSQPTTPTSTDASSSPAQRVFDRIPESRPDLRLAVLQQQQERQASA